MEFVDAILDLTGSAVDGVGQMPGGGAQIGYDKARVVLWLAPFQTHHLCLDQDPTLVTLPRSSSIARLAKHIRRLAGALRASPRLAHQSTGATLQYLVFTDSHDVVDFLLLEQVQYPRPAHSPTPTHQN